ncbi:MAG: cofactor-independent phosphoglycerate mutase [Planctomycetes bacterium]|nr:cofactor-independent phosphoglycerate mutase [Planctomycetota bacterium]
MKYAIIVLDGAADEPMAELDDQTVLEKAAIPHIDWISQNGQQGLVQTIPNGFMPGGDVAMLNVLGYNPTEYYKGLGSLEAAAREIHTGPEDWVFRCNLVTVADGKMVDYSAGHIEKVQAEELINDLNRELANDTLRFYPGLGYRHLMVYHGGNFEGELTPPHNIMDQPVSKYPPRCKQGKILRKIMQKAGEILRTHEVNQVRLDLGENEANYIWLWGQGRRWQLDGFRRRFGMPGAVIAAVDAMKGLAKTAGMKIIDVVGATGGLDTIYQGKGEAAIAALKDYDLVLVHIEAPDEAGLDGLVTEKIKAIEQIDLSIAGPLLNWLQKKDQWRIMILPNIATPVQLRRQTNEPVPFTLAGTDISGGQTQTFSEINAKNSGLRIDKGHELMEFFLKAKGQG